MNIKGYYDGLQDLYKSKSLEEKKINKKITELERDPVVQEYNELNKELGDLQYKYSKHEYLKEALPECEHPLYIYDYDLISLNCIVNCARCVICGKIFYDIDDIDLVKLYNNKRLIAKSVPLREDFYDFGTVDYELSLNELRKIYYQLYQMSNNGNDYNVEDYLFDHLTGNNKDIRRREK